MSTSGSLFAKPKSSLVGDSSSDASQQPSTVWFKLNHDRSLADAAAAASDVDADLEADVEEHDDADGDTDFDEHEHEHEHENEHEHDNGVGGDSSGEHARELSDGDDVKEHVFPLNDNELHNEMHSIEELQLQLQQSHDDHEEDTADADADHESDAETDPETDSHYESSARPDALPSTTESPAIEVRLKQIAQDFEKMTSSQELQRAAVVSKDEMTPQSSLSLSDLIRTLRPNEQQIIPQIDSDYSNAMRVLGKTSAVVLNNNNNNEDSRKFKVLPEPHSF
ncbi:surface protein [Drosophila grimshawi]|uniref:GH21409 n=1 Tax=Drosophila grimshawi TaxID=7222 RepID=B4J936_DROGR|nr:surface protein [Drosophila grimshawi]EDW01385.1 GH21409 [Drosophila grimshawi]